MDNFFTHYENIEEGLGYGLFTKGHFLCLGLSLLIIILIIHKYLKSDDDKKLKLRRLIGIFLIVIDIIKMIIMYNSPMDYTDYLPLEMCSFAAYSIVLDSIFKDNKFFSEPLLLVFLSTATIALCFPTTVDLPLLNFFTIHQFTYHLLIIAYVLMRFINKEISVTYVALWKSILKVLVLMSLIYFVDLLFNKNYMFLMDSAGNPALDVFYKLSNGGLLYIVCVVIFVIFALHILFIIYKGADKLIKS